MAALVTVTLAPATTEPDESVTTPEIPPRSSCAKDNWLAQHSTMNVRLKLRNLSQLLSTEPNVLDVTLASKCVENMCFLCEQLPTFPVAENPIGLLNELATLRRRSNVA